MVFIDLKKVYDRVTREILKWTFKKKVLSKVYVNVIEDMYEGASKRVWSLCKKTLVRAGVRRIR